MLRLCDLKSLIENQLSELNCNLFEESLDVNLVRLPLSEKHQLETFRIRDTNYHHPLALDQHR